MYKDNKTKIKDYLKIIKSAQNEQVIKERFIVLIQSLFGEMPLAKDIIDEFIAGAEKPITHIQRVGKKSNRGRADTQYRNIIIEWEKDLKKTGNHAKSQLADYLSGNWNTGSPYTFTLIATDGINWKIYTPDIENLNLEVTISADEVILKEKQEFKLSERFIDEFYFFLDATIFNIEKKRPTLDTIKRDFGDGSNVFLTASSFLSNFFQKEKESSEIKIAYQEWSRFLSIAYDKFESSENVFITHTYLSIFSRLLTYEVITKDTYIDENETLEIISGRIFEKLNIQNFTDNDFFSWVSSKKAIKYLQPMLRAITSEFDEFDFTHISEDILKGVYQDLIDIDTKQRLGEYYTPDWLCEDILNNLDLKVSSKVLDPSCGSGSFLRAAINKFNNKFEDLSADQIAGQVFGFDIHPLSVQISKATVLISLKDKIRNSHKPIYLSIFLANTLYTPTASTNLNFFGDTFDILIDKNKVQIDINIFENPKIFEVSVNTAGSIAEFTKNKSLYKISEFRIALEKRLKQSPSSELLNCIFEIYKALKLCKEENRDSIWEFIILNLYKPFFLRKSFDFVIGNPPWFTMTNISNSDYQERLKVIAKKTGTWPKKVANAPHMEIASIFLAHCTEYFLKETGKLIFVLPRSFFNAEHHHNTRAGITKFVRIKEVWDLKEVSPLFKVPSCVLITERAIGSINTSITSSGLKGKIFSGKFKKQNLKLSDVKNNLSVKNTIFYLNTLGSNTSLSSKNLNIKQTLNAYKNDFFQGATITPRNFYFIEPEDQFNSSIKNSIFSVTTSKFSNENSKKPWKDIIIKGRINSEYLYYTAISGNVLPFKLHQPQLVVLPLDISNINPQLFSSHDFMKEGEIEMAQWFKNVEQSWEENKTEKSKKMSNLQRLNYSKNLTRQRFSDRYIVVYTASSKDANSAVIDRQALDFNFVAESKTYIYTSNSSEEAHYICAFLNSHYANTVIKDFQTMGLFGPRDIHKKILDVSLPRFEVSNPDHLLLSKLSIECHSRSQEYCEKIKLESHFSPVKLGIARLNIRGYLKKELNQIDNLLSMV